MPISASRSIDPNSNIQSSPDSVQKTSNRESDQTTSSSSPFSKDTISSAQGNSRIDPRDTRSMTNSQSQAIPSSTPTTNSSTEETLKTEKSDSEKNKKDPKDTRGVVSDQAIPPSSVASNSVATDQFATAQTQQAYAPAKVE